MKSTICLYDGSDKSQIPIKLEPGEEIIQVRAGREKTKNTFIVVLTTFGNLYINRDIHNDTPKFTIISSNVDLFEVYGNWLLLTQGCSLTTYVIDDSNRHKKPIFKKEFDSKIIKLRVTKCVDIVYFVQTSSYNLHYCNKETILSSFYDVVLFNVFNKKLVYLTNNDNICNFGNLSETNVITENSDDSPNLDDFPDDIYIFNNVFFEKKDKLSNWKDINLNIYKLNLNCGLKFIEKNGHEIKGIEQTNNTKTFYQTRNFIVDFDVTISNEKELFIIIENEPIGVHEDTINEIISLDDIKLNVLSNDVILSSHYISSIAFNSFYNSFNTSKINDSTLTLLHRFMKYGSRIKLLQVFNNEFFDKIISQIEKKEISSKSICFIFEFLVFSITKSPLKYQDFKPSNYANNNKNLFNKNYGFPIPPSRYHVFQLSETLFVEMDYMNKDDTKSALNSILKLLLISIVINIEKFISFSLNNPAFRKDIKIKDLIKLLEILFSIERTDFNLKLISQLTLERFQDIYQFKDNKHILTLINQFWANEYDNESCKAILMDYLESIKGEFKKFLEDNYLSSYLELKNRISSFIQGHLPQLTSYKHFDFEKEIKEIISLQDQINRNLRVIRAYQTAFEILNEKN